MQTKLDLSNFHIQEFLTQNWQKKPLFIQGAIEPGKLELDKNILAGLACEPEVESRLIFNSENDRKILIEDGPFDENKFAELNNQSWSLMVQKADHWLEQIHQLRNYFHFLPYWQFDDIMASYGTDKSSSGPHIDNYDVFILQTQGIKNWRLEKKSRPLISLEEKDFIADLDVRIVKEFSNYDEYVLKPGDLLYIPAGYAHWGISEGESLSYSIGYRTPSIKELAKNYLYQMIEKIDDDDFFHPSTIQENMGEIPSSLFKDLKDQWPNFLPHLDHSILQRFAEVVTSAGFETTNPNEDEYQGLNLQTTFEQKLIQKAPGAKFSYLNKNDSVLLYVDGNVYSLSPNQLPIAQLLCNHLELNTAALAEEIKSHENSSLILKLLSTSSLELLDEEL